MNRLQLNIAVQEAERFLERARDLHGKRGYGPDHYYNQNPIEQGAVKRASMDLTRALAMLRKSG